MYYEIIVWINITNQ